MNCLRVSPSAIAHFARCLSLLIGLGLGLATGSVQALTTLDRAAAVLSVDGAPPRHTEIDLPFHWDAVHGGSTGSARFTFEVQATTIGVDHALLLPRVGNSFRIRFNGQLIAQRGSASNAYDDYSKRPHLAQIPAALVAPGNRLEIEIDAQSVRKAGLSRLLFGTATEVMPIYASQHDWRVTGSLVVVVISLILGSIALLLWIRQRDVLYLIYASAELLWGLAMGDMLIERPFLPWPWWGVITYSAQAAAGMLICKFALIVVQRNRGALRSAINLVLLLCAPMLALALIGGWPVFELLVLLPSQLIGLGVAVLVVRVGLASAELEDPRRHLREQLRQLRCQRLGEQRRDLRRSDEIAAGRRIAQLARPGGVVAEARRVERELHVAGERNPAAGGGDLGLDAFEQARALGERIGGRLGQCRHG